MTRIEVHVSHRSIGCDIIPTRKIRQEPSRPDDDGRQRPEHDRREDAERCEATETSTAGVRRMPSCSAATARSARIATGIGWWKPVAGRHEADAHTYRRTPEERPTQASRSVSRLKRVSKF